LGLEALIAIIRHYKHTAKTNEMQKKQSIKNE